MGLYERYVAPPLINFCCGQAPIRGQRQKIAPLAEGVVLELEFGAGLNLPHNDRSEVKQLLALEPAAGMLARARKVAAGSDLPVEILPETAQVLVTYSRCTTPDTKTALEGARIEPVWKVVGAGGPGSDTGGRQERAALPLSRP